MAAQVGVVRSVSSLQILTVGVSIKESRWLDLGAVTSTFSFDLFGGMVQFLQPSRLMMNNCKPVFHGVMP